MSKVNNIGLRIYRDLKIRVCGKGSIYLMRGKKVQNVFITH